MDGSHIQMRLLIGQIPACQLYSTTYRIGASLARQIATRPQTPARKANVSRWRTHTFILSRCRSPGPGATGTETQQSSALYCLPLGHAADAAYLRPCSTVHGSVRLFLPGYAPPCGNCAQCLKKVANEMTTGALQTHL